MDFNVDPMTAVIGKRVVDQLHLFDEISLQDSNTEQMAKEIRERYPHPRKDHGLLRPVRQLKEDFGAEGKQTDFAILRSFGNDQSSRPRLRRPVVDRINDVNALCKSANGTLRFFVHPSKCSRIVTALENLPYKKDTSQPNESATAPDGTQMIHITDALGYLVHTEFPIVIRRGMFAA